MKKVNKYSLPNNLLDLKYISKIFNTNIVKCTVVEIKYRNSLPFKFTIKYITDNKDVFYIKKHDDYDFQKVNKLIPLIYKSLYKENILYKTKDPQLIACQEIKGKELLKVLNKKNIKLLSKTISQFHNLPPSKFKNYINEKNCTLRNIRYIDGGDVIKRIKTYDIKVGEKVLSLYKDIHKIENKILQENKLHLIHGDFHPQNIVVNKKGLNFIDLKNVCLGLKERDIATLLEQMEALRRKTNKKESDIIELQKVFLENYENEFDQSLVLFYQAWITWRNSMYSLLRFYTNNMGKYKLYLAINYLHKCQKYLDDYKKVTKKKP